MPTSINVAELSASDVCGDTTIGDPEFSFTMKDSTTGEYVSAPNVLKLGTLDEQYLWIEGHTTMAGTYRLGMSATAKDENGNSASLDPSKCYMTVEIKNLPPIADLYIERPSRQCDGATTSVELDVSKSFDPNDGDKLTFSWFIGDEQKDSWTGNSHKVGLTVGTHLISVQACDSFGLCDRTPGTKVYIQGSTVRGL